MSSENTTTVMVCMDGSEHSENALRYYKDKIHRPENKVVLVHCVQFTAHITPMSMASADPTAVHAMIQNEEKKTKNLLDHIEKEASQLGLEAKVSRTNGEPGPALLEMANEINASLIVTGSRGLGTLRRTLMGSVSDYLIHHAHVPMLVCKTTPL